MDLTEDLGESDGEPPDAPEDGGRDHLLGPACPICSKRLGPSTSNTDLNDHIDWCLNRDAIENAGMPTPKKARIADTAKRKRPKEIGKGTMLAWLKKEK